MSSPNEGIALRERTWGILEQARWGGLIIKTMHMIINIIITIRVFISWHFRLHRHRLLGRAGCVCHFHVLRPHAAHKDRSTTSRVSIHQEAACSYVCVTLTMERKLRQFSSSVCHLRGDGSSFHVWTPERCCNEFLWCFCCSDYVGSRFTLELQLCFKDIIVLLRAWYLTCRW